MKCINCGAEVTGRFCSYCGSEIPQKETNIHIEHNEKIVNNYNYSTSYDFDEEENQNNGIGLFSSIVNLAANIVMFPFKVIGGLAIILIAICFIFIAYNILEIIFSLFL